MTYPNSFAYFISSADILVIPSVYTSANVTLELNAIDAIIAIFLPAS